MLVFWAMLKMSLPLIDYVTPSATQNTE